MPFKPISVSRICGFELIKNRKQTIRITLIISRTASFEIENVLNEHRTMANSFHFNHSDMIFYLNTAGLQVMVRITSHGSHV